MKGSDKVPLTNSDTYPGLLMAFELAEQGKSDRQVAMSLNAVGYRTAGNQGNRPISKDKVGGMLTNIFYLGYLSNGNGSPIKAKHEPFIGHELFEAVQKQRRKNLKSTHKHAVQGKTIYSLTGITWCW